MMAKVWRIHPEQQNRNFGLSGVEGVVGRGMDQRIVVLRTPREAVVESWGHAKRLMCPGQSLAE